MRCTVIKRNDSRFLNFIYVSYHWISQFSVTLFSMFAIHWNDDDDNIDDNNNNNGNGDGQQSLCKEILYFRVSRDIVCILKIFL